MMRFRKMESIVEAVGNTPMVRLRALEKDAPGTKIYLKLEYANPGGSVKDRPARQMMLDAIEDGRLTHDKALIDATSGNTGVAYSLFGAAMGYRVKLVMPSNVSQARKDIAQAFGPTGKKHCSPPRGKRPLRFPNGTPERSPPGRQSLRAGSRFSAH